jgi:hypothetical protein
MANSWGMAVVPVSTAYCSVTCDVAHKTAERLRWGRV